MTQTEFNIKWSAYLFRSDCYGLDISDLRVVEYLDNKFTKEIEENPGFRFRQIKIKLQYPRIYSNSPKNSEWEDAIGTILNLQKPTW